MELVDLRSTEKGLEMVIQPELGKSRAPWLEPHKLSTAVVQKVADPIYNITKNVKYPYS